MKLLDLFCCAGGASMGYHRAGFEVTGVDIKDQPSYPFKFIKGDVIDILKDKDNTYPEYLFRTDKNELTYYEKEEVSLLFCFDKFLFSFS